MTTQKPGGGDAHGRHAVLTQLSLGGSIVAILALGLLIIFSPHHLVYDEAGQLLNVDELYRVGWIAMLRSPSITSEAGPLYTAIHAGLAGLTQLTAPAVRFPNFVLLVGSILGLAATARSLRLANPALVACSILAVPFLWASAGMALTELPALFCFTGSVLACVLLEGEIRGTRWAKRMGLALAGGVLLGLACLGRQTYLVALVPLVVFCRRDPASWLGPAIVAFAAIAVSGWLFVIWGGLLPPHLASLLSQPQGFHGVLSFGYLALVTLIVTPRWMLRSDGSARSWNRASYAIALVSIVVAGLFLAVEVAPARTLAERTMPPSMFVWYPRLIGPLIVGLAGLWLMRFGREMWLVRQEPAWLYIHLALFLLALTPIAITHQFSSRYVVTDLGLLVLILWKQCPPISWSHVGRFGLGAALGSMILLSYYQ